MMIFKNIPIGAYFPGDSLLHRLQARTKLLLFLCFIICLFVANHHKWYFAPYIVIVLLLCAGIALSGVPLRELWQRMWLLVLFSITGAIFTLLAPPETGQKILATPGPFAFPLVQVYGAALAYCLLLALYILALLLRTPALRRLRRHLWLVQVTSRSFLVGPVLVTYDNVWFLLSGFTFFLVLYTLALLLTMTTTPVAMIEGMTLLLTPLRWLRLPIDDFALMTLLALRFIPTLIEEVEQLVKAQASRGADFSRGTIRERLQGVSALFIPFMQGTLRRAAELATALEARGSQGEKGPPPLHETSLGRIDYMVLGVVILVMAGVLLV